MASHSIELQACKLQRANDSWSPSAPGSTSSSPGSWRGKAANRTRPPSWVQLRAVRGGDRPRFPAPARAGSLPNHAAITRPSKTGGPLRLPARGTTRRALAPASVARARPGAPRRGPQPSAEARPCCRPPGCCTRSAPADSGRGRAEQGCSSRSLPASRSPIPSHHKKFFFLLLAAARRGLGRLCPRQRRLHQRSPLVWPASLLRRSARTQSRAQSFRCFLF
jgi:hypothetical protein